MNDLSKVVDKLLAQGLLALRGTCVMPRLVNSDYSNLAAQQGASIDVPIPSAIKAQAVTPGATSQDTGDISPVSATIKLDRWMEAPFYLTDKDLMEANRGVIPMQASEAVKAIANDVNATLLGLGRKFYGMVGTPGTTPFSTVVDATNARKVLNRQLAPVNDRRIVLDPDAEAEGQREDQCQRQNAPEGAAQFAFDQHQRIHAASRTMPRLRSSTLSMSASTASSWLTTRSVLPSVRAYPESSKVTCPALASSRLAVGSSARMMPGLSSTARAMATRCFSPRDSARTFRVGQTCICSSRPRPRRIKASGMRHSVKVAGRSTFSSASSSGKSWKS